MVRLLHVAVTPNKPSAIRLFHKEGPAEIRQTPPISPRIDVLRAIAVSWLQEVVPRLVQEHLQCSFCLLLIPPVVSGECRYGVFISHPYDGRVLLSYLDSNTSQ